MTALVLAGLEAHDPLGFLAALGLVRVLWTQAERAACGIETVFSSRILRSDQGGHGSFAPAAVVPPSSAAGRGPSGPAWSAHR